MNSLRAILIVIHLKLFRYFLIIIIGFGPLIILLKIHIWLKRFIFFKHFNYLLNPISILYTPVIFLFAMGVDWGRWVNISYVFGIILYIYLYKQKYILIDEKLYKIKVFNFLNKKKIFIFIFIIFCFSWIQKL